MEMDSNDTTGFPQELACNVVAVNKNTENHKKRWKYRCGCNCDCARRHKSSFVIPPLPDDYFQPPPSYNEAVKTISGFINGIRPKPKFFEPPQITWPLENKFNALYLGTDNNGRTILRFNDDHSVESYSNTRKTWCVYLVTLGKETVVPLKDLEIGMFVLANNKIGDLDHFVRAKVLFVNCEDNWVKVLDMDEWEELIIKKENIFWMNEFFLTVHFQAISCEIYGFSFLIGGPILKMVMDESLTNVFPPKCIIHVDKIQIQEPHPVVSFSKWPFQIERTVVGEEIQSVLVNWAPKVQKEVNHLEQILISHADELGYIWLQVHSALTFFLTHLENPLSKYPGRRTIVDIKTDIENGETIFLGMFSDETWYRVKLIEFFPDDEKAFVEFIDFGNQTTISIADMLPCEILVGRDSSVFKSLPPQCAKVHLQNIDLLNLDLLWGFVPVESRIDLTVCMKQRSQRIARQVELYTYVDGKKRTESLNEFLLTKNYARHIGGRKIEPNMRIPLTKKFLPKEVLDRAEKDIRKKKVKGNDDLMYSGIKRLFHDENSNML